MVVVVVVAVEDQYGRWNNDDASSQTTRPSAAHRVRSSVMSGREIMVRNAPMGPPNSYSNDGADGDGDDDATEGAVEADDDDAEEMVGPTAPLIAPPATVGGGRDGYLSLGFSRIVVVVICCCICDIVYTIDRGIRDTGG